MNEDPEVKEEIEAKQEELGTCLERCNVLRGELAELKRPHCPQGGKCDFDTFRGAKSNPYSIQYKCKNCDKTKWMSRGGGRRRITATRRKRGAKKSRRKGGLNFATAMGCKEGQVLASGSRCGFFRGLNPRYMMTGQCCNNQGGGKKKCPVSDRFENLQRRCRIRELFFTLKRINALCARVTLLIF